MGYLLQQILWYCLIAFLLGLVVGWWMARAAGSRLIHDLEARVRGGTEELDALRREVRDLRTRLAESETALADARRQADAAAAKVDEARAEAAAARHRLTDIEAIEGIGTGYGKRLKAIGIDTVERLLEVCATDEGVERVRAATDEDTHVVHTWATMADLMRIRGLGGQWAELLWRSGIMSVQDLASRDAAALTPLMEAVNEKEHRVKELPGVQRLEHFIAEAAELPRAIPDRVGPS